MNGRKHHLLVGRKHCMDTLHTTHPPFRLLCVALEFTRISSILRFQQAGLVCKREPSILDLRVNQGLHPRPPKSHPDSRSQVPSISTHPASYFLNMTVAMQALTFGLDVCAPFTSWHPALIILLAVPQDACSMFGFMSESPVQAAVHH